MKKLPLLALVLAGACSASTLTFSTASGATAGGVPVNASAAFTLNGTSTVTLKLFNNVADPNSVGQNISDISFDAYAGGMLVTSSASITGFSGTEITVAGNGTYTSSAVNSLPASSYTLAYDSSLNAYHLDALGTGQPQDTIIGAPSGSGKYTNANSSIAGNGPHNPFLQSGASFMLGFGTAQITNISNVVFSFGTTSGVTSPGGTPITTQATPEPGSIGLLASGLGALAFLARRRKA